MQAHGIGQVPYPTMSPNFVGDIVPCDPLQLASFKFEKQRKKNMEKAGKGRTKQNTAARQLKQDSTGEGGEAKEEEKGTQLYTSI